MFNVGQIVRYDNKDDLVCVKEIVGTNKCRTWSHLGNTGALGSNDLYSVLSSEDIINRAKSNARDMYLVKSYIVRREMYRQTGDVNAVDMADESVMEISDSDVLRYNFDEVIIPD